MLAVRSISARAVPGRLLRRYPPLRCRYPPLRDAAVAATAAGNGREARARLSGADPDAGREEHLRPRAGPIPTPPAALRRRGRRNLSGESEEPRTGEHGAVPLELLRSASFFWSRGKERVEPSKQNVLRPCGRGEIQRNWGLRGGYCGLWEGSARENENGAVFDPFA